ncbi:MAG TPA: FAD-dependent oxidoreductase, partial [Bryobacteraceae bacterium]|nr:FAD-dependent oxidoreductase [Bryobacteraceae bacterium]
MLLFFLGILQAQQVTLLDVQQVPVEGDPGTALRTFRVPDQPREIACDLLVAGGGPGGIGAAIAATARNHSVCLTEET